MKKKKKEKIRKMLVSEILKKKDTIVLHERKF